MIVNVAAMKSSRALLLLAVLLILPLAASAQAPGQNVKLFLKLDKIDGDSGVAGHEKGHPGAQRLLWRHAAGPHLSGRWGERGQGAALNRHPPEARRQDFAPPFHRLRLGRAYRDRDDHHPHDAGQRYRRQPSRHARECADLELPCRRRRRGQWRHGKHQSELHHDDDQLYAGEFKRRAGAPISRTFNVITNKQVAEPAPQ